MKKVVRAVSLMLLMAGVCGNAFAEENEIRAYAKGQSYKGTPLYQHNYWWSSSENSINGNAYYIHSESTASIGAVSKGGDWWVIAFKNGKMEE